jgi:cell division septation protein DedD
MPGRDDGEFELILGNKQLLSVLFIVIVLLGVFFAMGFLAGRSTGAGATEVARKDADQVPITVDAATSKSSEPTPHSPVAETAPAEHRPAETPAPPRTEQPAAVESKAPPAKPVETPRAAPAGGFVQTPPEGTYLQVAAIRRADAEAMLNYIGEKTRLRGYVTPVPKSSETFRVIIGPLKSNEDMADARTRLSDIGIKTPYPVKY